MAADVLQIEEMKTEIADLAQHRVGIDSEGTTMGHRLQHGIAEPLPRGGHHHQITRGVGVVNSEAPWHVHARREHWRWREVVLTHRHSHLRPDRAARTSRRVSRRVPDPPATFFLGIARVGISTTRVVFERESLSRRSLCVPAAGHSQTRCTIVVASMPRASNSRRERSLIVTWRHCA